MNAETKQQYNSETLRRLRNDHGLTMKEFWGAMGYNLSRGCAYENGKNKIPEHVNRLVHLHYIAGIPTDFRSSAFTRFIEQQKGATAQARQILSDALTELEK